eukprot:gene10216-12528_t
MAKQSTKKTTPTKSATQKRKKNQDVEIIEEEEEEEEIVPLEEPKKSTTKQKHVHKEKTTTTTSTLPTGKYGAIQVEELEEDEILEYDEDDNNNNSLEYDHDDNWKPSSSSSYTTTKTTTNITQQQQPQLQSQSYDLPSSFSTTRSDQINPETIFFKPKKRNTTASSEYWDDEYEPIRTSYGTTSPLQYNERITNYTNQQLENLSRDIRRHPNLVSRSYHFLNQGLSTKITHQWIRITIALMVLFGLVFLVLKAPLPILSPIQLSPTTPHIEVTPEEEFRQSYSPQYGVSPQFLTPFKENWRKFSIVGISNFLCSNYNFNPTSAEANSNILNHGTSLQDLKNLKIFGSCVVSGVVLFVLWLLAARLAEKEIILDSNIPYQVLHAALSLVAIPMAAIIFWSIFILYFIQTILIGTQPNGQEDIFYCVNRLSSGLGELSSFSPLREIMISSVSMVMRVANYIFSFPVDALTLHDKPSGVSDNQIKIITVFWTVVIGCAVYQTLKVVSYIYSIFRDNPPPRSTECTTTTSSTTTTTSATTTTTTITSTRTLNPNTLMTLDMKFLPSFIPEILFTQNFIILFLWGLTSFYLWYYGSPIKNVHEGEIFFISLAFAPIIKSIYNLTVIAQKKDLIEKLHKDNDVYAVVDEEEDINY